MGRGDGSKNSAATAAAPRRGGTRARSAATTLELRSMLASEGGLSEGELVTLRNGQDLELDGQTPAGAVRGLDQVTDLSAQGPGRYAVSFADGTRAIVDLNRMAVALPGADTDPAKIDGALARALAEQARFADEGDASDATIALADAFDNYKNNPDDPQALTALAQAAQGVLAEREGNLTLNPADLVNAAGPQAEGAVTPRQRVRALVRAARERAATAFEHGGSEAAGRSLIYGMNMESGDVSGPTEEQLEERRQAAEELAAPIPDDKILFDEKGNSIGEFEVTSDVYEKFNMVRNRLAVGQRAFLFRGPPGSGKDAFASQIAALRDMPLVQLTVGPTYSWEDAISGDVLETQVINGQPSTVTGQAKGALARALEKPCVIVVQEPEGMENEAVRLHSMLGDNVGEPETRRLTLNSVKGDREVKVHPDCIVIFTYNSGEEDVRFKTAVHDRALNLDFEYPNEEEEAKRYARMVTKMMMRDELADEAPELRREYSPDEVLPVVKLMRQLRNAHREAPDDFVEVPGARQGVHVFTDLLLQAYSGDRDAADNALKPLMYLLPGSENMTADDRIENLLEQATDVRTKLQELAAAARDKNPTAKN